MCKSASSLLFWYTRQLVAGAFESTAQQALREATSSEKLPGMHEFVNPLSQEGLNYLLSIAAPDRPMVVKCHMPLTPYLRDTIESGRVKMLFSYRDPRDMILSAIDHHHRCVKNNKRQAFANFSDIQTAIAAAHWWCDMAVRWVESDLPLIIRYVEAVKTPATQIRRIASLLNLDVSAEQAKILVEKEASIRSQGKNEFNRGKLLRYPLEMSQEEIQQCNRELGEYISRLGFFVNNSYLNGQRKFSLLPIQRDSNLAKKRRAG